MCSPMGVEIGKGPFESETLRRSCLGRAGRGSAYLTRYVAFPCTGMVAVLKDI